MRAISRSEIHPIKMAIRIPDEIVNAGMRVISEGFIYEYVGIGWIKQREARMQDYLEIPQLIG